MTRWIVQFFMERGFAMPAWVTISGHSHPFLKMAADSGHLPVVQLIIGNGDGALPSSSHWGNFIGSAAERDHFSVVKVIVEEFADSELEKRCWAEALCLAPGANQMEIVQYFVQHFVQLGVGLDTNDYSFATPLSAAASKGHLDMLRYMLTHGGDVNCISWRSPAHFYKAIEKAK